MPLNSPTGKEPGTLYVVGTPIGNMEDITLRAIRVLREVDLVAAEDTRTTGKLFTHHSISNRLISYHEHNEEEQTGHLINKLQQGLSIALVSDAGTPSLSDPGYRLVRKAIANAIKVIPVPGVSAAITALCAAGLPTDSFVFIGFLPKKQKQRHDLLEKISKETRTIIFYESPKRVLSLLEEMQQFMGDRDSVLCREMTKTYEEFIRGNISEIYGQMKGRNSIKGECTLVVGGPIEKDSVSDELLRNEIVAALEKENATPSNIAKEISKKYNLSKKNVYEEMLRIKDCGKDRW